MESHIPETHGPFRNCIPVGVNHAIFLFHASIWQVFSIKIVRASKNCQIAAFLMISKWGVMWKSDFFSLVHDDFTFFKNVWKFVNGRRNSNSYRKEYIFSKYIYLFEVLLKSVIFIYFNICFRCGHRCCIGLLEPHTPRKISTPWYMGDICQGNLNLTISQHTYKSLTQGISWQNDIFHTTTLILQH